MDICQCPGYLSTKSSKLLDVPTEPSILHSISGVVRMFHPAFSPRILSALVPRGLIGPTRQFGEGTLYHPELYAIIIGAALPIPFWLWQRRYPNSWVKFVSTPVLLNGVSAIPPASGINYSAWFATGFVFQYLVRKRNFAWWSKFNYVTSAALDSGAFGGLELFELDTVLMLFFTGTSMSILVIFFSLQVRNGCVFFCLPAAFAESWGSQFIGGGVPLNWWGNTVYKNSALDVDLASRRANHIVFSLHCQLRTILEYRGKRSRQGAFL